MPISQLRREYEICGKRFDILLSQVGKWSVSRDEPFGSDVHINLDEVKQINEI